MESIKVYRNVNAVDRVFGLELVDAGVLVLVFFFAFLFNREGLVGNGAMLALTYVGLRALKRGKPNGYVLGLTRYLLSTRFKRATAFDEAEGVPEVQA